MIDILTGIVCVWLFIASIWYWKIYKKTFEPPKPNRILQLLIGVFYYFSY